MSSPASAAPGAGERPGLVTGRTARPAIGLGCGPGAARTLRGARDGRVELVLRHGAYLRFGEDWVLLCGPSAALGPLSLTVSGLTFDAIEPRAPVRRDKAQLLVGGERISLERVRERRSVGFRARAHGIQPALAAARAAVPSPPASLSPGLAALERDDPLAAIPLLAGLGEGLTPAGDDVLAGYAAWRQADGLALELAATAGARRRCSPLGLAYLRCAERGELPDLAERALAALRAGESAATARATQALAGWGSSSGAAYVWGFGAGARAAAGEDARAQASASAPSSAARNRSFSARVP